MDLKDLIIEIFNYIGLDESYSRPKIEKFSDGYQLLSFNGYIKIAIDIWNIHNNIRITICAKEPFNNQMFNLGNPASLENIKQYVLTYARK